MALDHQPQRSWRKLTPLNPQIIDPDDRLGLCVASVEVWRRMVVEIHVDGDAEEFRDLGHLQAAARSNTRNNVRLIFGTKVQDYLQDMADCGGEVMGEESELCAICGQRGWV